MPSWNLFSRRRRSVAVTQQQGALNVDARSPEAPVAGGFPEVAPRRLLDDDASAAVVPTVAAQVANGKEVEQRKQAWQTGGDRDGIYSNNNDDHNENDSDRRASRAAASSTAPQRRLGLFRSRSTHFDLGSGSEGELAQSSSGIARRSTIASLYFPETSPTPRAPALGGVASTPDSSQFGAEAGVGRDTPTLQHGSAAIGDSVKQVGGRLQKRLKRLPSLTLRRGFSFRGGTNKLSKAPPSSVAKPGTVVSCDVLFSLLFVVVFSVFLLASPFLPLALGGCILQTCKRHRPSDRRRVLPCYDKPEAASVAIALGAPGLGASAAP
ncbi:hypothetical protein BD289DRAFT_428490 [Coniella lustricola]|uniref:Transmembrane protein n=1 Tax=Coniella lustricola TaxID=2025994 RepID=A0A2T3ADZ0_9PEZI|nr:hypothetical protein BD289DRAFT_428490 [Coniella lustricola]